MRLAYNGATFHGWQSQPNAISVQSTIEEAMSMILHAPIKITGAGRTDAGVNARSMVAHFDLDNPLPDVDGVVRSINSLVGKNIAIHSIEEVHSEAHARFDAISRTYHYYTHRGKSPFLHTFSWQEPSHLDFEAMNQAASVLLEVEDFSSFAKLHSDAKTNRCNVTYARWEETDNGHVFVITADRFLRNMVRAIVGTLVDVGRGKLNVEQFIKVIEGRDRRLAGTSMPPYPLFLWDVVYPY